MMLTKTLGVTLLMTALSFSAWGVLSAKQDNTVVSAPELQKEEKPSQDVVDIQEELHQVLTKASSSFVHVGSASGMLIGDKYYVLTNEHCVVRYKEDVPIYIKGVGSLKAKKLAEIKGDDAALLEIVSKKKLSLKPLKLSRQNVVPGQWVFTLGNPYGVGTRTRSPSVSLGVVCAQDTTAAIHPMYDNGIHTDASINPGNSGGPVINMQGEVVGIAGKHRPRFGDRCQTGSNFAVGMDVILALVAKAKIFEGYNSIEKMSFDVKQGIFNVKKATGDFKEGDIISKVDGMSFKDRKELLNHVAFQVLHGKEKAVFDVLRGTDVMKIELNLEAEK